MTPRLVGSEMCIRDSHRHVLSPRDKTYRKIHSVHGLSLFSSNIVIHLSSSLDVCVGVRECARVLSCVVFLFSPLRIMIKMNLFCILGRLQGRMCQLCQIILSLGLITMLLCPLSLLTPLSGLSLLSPLSLLSVILSSVLSASLIQFCSALPV